MSCPDCCDADADEFPPLEVELEQHVNTYVTQWIDDWGHRTSAVHVVPTYGREHVTDGEPCWCGAEPQEDDDGNVLVLHVCPN